MGSEFSFEIQTTSSTAEHNTARAGVLRIGDKMLPTPAFMPVGTLATVKSLSLEDLLAIDAPCILANTYHLHLRPGEDVVANLGGLHSFMGGWPRLILTDSGGYQVFSLAHLRSVDEGGATFRAHTDGSAHRFTPESVMEIQEKLGSDIMIALDECPPHTTGYEQARESAKRTARWAARAQESHRDRDGILFPVSQGGMHEDLRQESARELAELEFDGYAIGGLGIGEEKDVMRRMLQASLSPLPVSKPRYLMGIGAPEDLVAGVAAGVDMFDSVLQTREARNGGLLTRGGRVNINNARFSEDPAPVEEGCDCSTCRTYSRAYLHHLFRNRELLGYRLATIHNLRWTVSLMHEIRHSLQAGTFSDFAPDFLEAYPAPRGNTPGETAESAGVGRKRDA